MNYKQVTKQFNLDDIKICMIYTVESVDGSHWEIDDLYVTIDNRAVYTPDNWKNYPASVVVGKLVAIHSLREAA